MTHEVSMLCNCDADPCVSEIYISDIRIAWGELERINKQMTDALSLGWWHTAQKVTGRLADPTEAQAA